jgi:thioredoxin 1
MKVSKMVPLAVVLIFGWVGWIVLDMTSPEPKATKSPSQLSATIQSSSVPVLVEFYADWCPPCRVVAPLLEELTQEVAGRAKVVKVDMDADQGLAYTHRVNVIPTFIVFKDGKEVARQSGAISKEKMREMLGL